MSGGERGKRWRRLAWLIFCNLAGVGVGVVVLLGAGEAWLRLTPPFTDDQMHMVFVPGFGWLPEPGTEWRYTNRQDVWRSQRVNSLGFLDREPPDAARAAAACHVAVIGDSYVMAQEVAIEDKLHVQLEALARERLPALDVVATAFGRADTAQVAQLAFYDEYVRPLAPKLVVLVFYANDFRGNFTPQQALYRRLPPHRLNVLAAVRDEQGDFRLQLPTPDAGRFTLPIRHFRWAFLGLASEDGHSFLDRAIDRAVRGSVMVRWLARKGLRERLPIQSRVQDLYTNAPEAVAAFGDLSWVQDLETPGNVWARRQLPPALVAGLDYTAFAFAEFQARAQRDGFALVVLAHEDVGGAGAPMFQRLKALARAAQVDVVNLHDHIVQQGGALAHGRLPVDMHWNPTGHRRAAEALFDYMAANQDVCQGVLATDPLSSG